MLEGALTIPPGEIRPYAWLAREVGRPKAVRAVGTALGHNPIPILIPCHRIVRSDGLIGDYAWGSETKRRALAAEGLDPDAIERLARRGERYIGSDTTHIVCLPTCRHAKRVTERHRVPFASLEAAEAAGYRGCKDCRPAGLTRVGRLTTRRASRPPAPAHRTPADLGEEGDRPFEVLHRFRLATLRVEEVREVVLERCLAVPIALALTARQRVAHQRLGSAEVPGIGLDQGERVERRDADPGVGRLVRRRRCRSTSSSVVSAAWRWRRAASSSPERRASIPSSASALAMPIASSWSADRSKACSASRMAPTSSPRPMAIAPVIDQDASGVRAVAGQHRGSREMTLRTHQVAAPGMDEADAMLDRAVARPVALGLGRLVVAERPGVVAAQREQVAERLVDGRRLGMAEGERGLEVLPRLGVGIHVACLVAGAKMGGGGLGRPARRGWHAWR